MSGFTYHLSTTYHLPSWQGGDVKRPICHAGLCGYGDNGLTDQRGKVSCKRCLAVMRGAPTPAKQPRVSISAQPLFLADLAPAALPPQAEPPAPHTPTMPEIARMVADVRGVTLPDLLSESRKHQFAHARQEAMWLMRRAGRTTTQVGRFFGRDHSTVTHAEQAHEGRLAEIAGVAA